MKKILLKIAGVAILATATILFGQIFFGAPILGTEPWYIDTNLGQAPDKSSADFSVYARQLFEQAKARPRIVEAGSLTAEERNTTRATSGNTGFSIEPDPLPGTTGSGLPLGEERSGWSIAHLPLGAYAVLWFALAGLTFWVIHVAHSHKQHHRHAI